MKTLVALIVIVLLASPAHAQTLRSRFDAAATRQAAPAAGPRPMSPRDRVLAGAVIGGTLGALSGWWLWRVFNECTCDNGRTNAIVSTGVVGAGIGMLIGASIGAPQRRPGIPIGRRVSVNPVVSPARVTGAVTVTF